MKIWILRISCYDIDTTDVFSSLEIAKGAAEAALGIEINWVSDEQYRGDTSFWAGKPKEGINFVSLQESVMNRIKNYSEYLPEPVNMVISEFTE